MTTKGQTTRKWHVYIAALGARSWKRVKKNEKLEPLAVVFSSATLSGSDLIFCWYRYQPFRVNFIGVLKFHVSVLKWQLGFEPSD